MAPLGRPVRPEGPLARQFVSPGPDRLQVLARFGSTRQEALGAAPRRDGFVPASLLEQDDAAHAVYEKLVELRGWTPERYQRWLTDTLTSALLTNADAEGPVASGEP